MAEITRKQARAALSCLDQSIETISAAVEEAPYRVAAPAARTLGTLRDAIAAELDLEIVGQCEGCDELIFEDEEHAWTEDGVKFCKECTPEPEDVA